MKKLGTLKGTKQGPGALLAFWSLDGRSFNLINDAFMILLKKKNEAQEIRDYRPISLMHSFEKLIAKCLARRLALVLNDLVHPVGARSSRDGPYMIISTPFT